MGCKPKNLPIFLNKELLQHFLGSLLVDATLLAKSCEHQFESRLPVVNNENIRDILRPGTQLDQLRLAIRRSGFHLVMIMHRKCQERRVGNILQPRELLIDSVQKWRAHALSDAAVLRAAVHSPADRILHRQCEHSIVLE